MPLTIGVLAVSQALVEAASWIGALAAIVAGLGVIAKARYIGRPLRWLWRHLVSEPLAGWFKGEVLTVVKVEVEQTVQAQFDRLMQPNSGKSLYDLAAALGRIERAQKAAHPEIDHPDGP